jgi:hypothetical protein
MPPRFRGNLNLRDLGQLFRDHGFEIKQVWETENRWLELDGSTWPTAFVAATNEGVELDVHVIKFEGGLVVPLCNVAWPLTETPCREAGSSMGGRCTAFQQGLSGDASRLRTAASPPARRGPATPACLKVAPAQSAA